MILLIHPPVTKPGEAPAGLGKLAGVLSQNGVPHRLLDANLEGLLYLVQEEGPAEMPEDNWSRRAFRHRAARVGALRAWPTYSNSGRYGNAVRDLSRVLQKTVSAGRIRMTLANYEDMERSPLLSADLMRAAASPEENPFYPYFRKRLLGLLEEAPPEIIGLSVNYLSQALCAFAIMGFLRQVLPAVKIVIGGGLVTSWAKRLGGANPFAGFVDVMIFGPGEGPLLALAGKTWDGSPVRPDYSAFPMEDYLSPGVVLPYGASQGCYWRSCSFCPEKAEGNLYSPIPADQVLQDLAHLNAQLRPSLIHFLDNALSPALLRALSKEKLPPWYGFARMTEHLMDRDFCRRLRESGCVMLKLGLESGSQDVLESLHKGIDLAVASRILKELKAAGIATYVYLLFGTPAENEYHARQTLDFVAGHGAYIDFLNVSVFNLPVDSAEDLETRSFYSGDLSLYRDFSHPEGWNRLPVRHFLDREFKRHPQVAAILRNDPPVFTSNHAPLFVMGKGRGPVSQEICFDEWWPSPDCTSEEGF